MLSVSTKILPQNVLNTVKRSRPIYAAARKMRFALGTRLGARAIPGVNGRVHFNDFMLTSTDPAEVNAYLHGSREFVDIIQRSCGEAGRDWQYIDTILEAGCGYGRIVRELTRRMPSARIYVSDVIEEGANFTAREFGAHKVPVLEQAGRSLDGQFDLVYLLSVYTHLRRDSVIDNLRQVAAVLKPGGVAVFTVHGQGSAETCERYDQYWLDKAQLLAALKRDGYYYEKYPYYYAEYGLTWFTRKAFEGLVAETAPDLAFVSYHPTDHDGHQDVFVFRKI